MKTFPDIDILTEYLSSMMPKSEMSIEIISRKEFYEASTFPVEIVKCKTAGGRTIDLFCKYLGGMGPNNYGHRGGVEYEANIYENVLNKTPCSKIKYYGQCRLAGGTEFLLVLEYLGETLQMKYSVDPDATLKASEWIGKFHHANEGNVPTLVHVYDRTYYLGWSERFRNLTSMQYEKFPWLERLSDYFDDTISLMIEGPLTIIHGEYYPKNILLKKGIIYPVDWESGAIAPGEIDLASLIEGWDKESAFPIIKKYKESRWPDGIVPIKEFEKRLLMSQIYFNFWWWPEKADNMNFDSEAFQKLFEMSKVAGVV